MKKPTASDQPKGPKAGPVLWVKYDVQWEILERLYGSVPADPQLVKKWLESRMPKTRPPDARSMESIQTEVVESILNAPEEEEIDYAMLTFQTWDGGLAMRSDTVRAHLKDCARTVSAQYLGRVENERAFSTRVINGVYQDPQHPWVPIVRADGSRVIAPDGWEDRAVHVSTPQGRRSALKRIAYVFQPILRFRLFVLGDSISEEDLNTLMLYGGVHGYAGERSRDGGKYIAKIVRVED